MEDKLKSFRKHAFVSIVVVASVLAIPGPAQAQEYRGSNANPVSTEIRAAGMSLSISGIQSVMTQLSRSASTIRTSTSTTTRNNAVNSAVSALSGIQFTGTAATALQTDINYLQSYARQGLWNTTAGKMDQIRGKLGAVVDAYYRAESDIQMWYK